MKPAAISETACLSRRVDRMKSFKHRRKKQSGNIFIYILGAIFLMGILIVVVKGTFQPGTGIDAEKAQLMASQIRAYGSELERAVNLVISNGFSESDIRFSNSADSAYGALTPATTYIAERQVFHAKGGGAEFKSAPSGSQVIAAPWVFTGSNLVEGVGKSCTTTQCTELIAVLPDVTKAVCIQINNTVGITNPSGNPPREASNFNYINSKFAGNYAYQTYLETTGDYTKYKLEGCFEGNSASPDTGQIGHYYYYKALLVR
jgi:hypothetical protein